MARAHAPSGLPLAPQVGGQHAEVLRVGLGGAGYGEMRAWGDEGMGDGGMGEVERESEGEDDDEEGGEEDGSCVRKGCER